jgi:hypothetical protein
MPNGCFIPGLGHTTMLLWTGDTMMSFDVLFEFVETVYRVKAKLIDHNILEMPVLRFCAIGRSSSCF